MAALIAAIEIISHPCVNHQGSGDANIPGRTIARNPDRNRQAVRDFQHLQSNKHKTTYIVINVYRVSISRHIVIKEYDSLTVAVIQLEA